jgi:hypothetical protein
LLYHCPYRPEDNYHSPSPALMHQINLTPCQYEQPRVVSPLLERHVVRALSPHLLQSMIPEELRVPSSRPIEMGNVFMPSATLELPSVCRTIDTGDDTVVAQRRAMNMTHFAASARRGHQKGAQSTSESSTATCRKSIEPASRARRSVGLSHQRTMKGDLVAAHHRRDSTILDETTSRLFNPEHHISPEGMPTTQIDSHYAAATRKNCNLEDSSDYNTELLALMNEDVISV